LSGHAVGHDIHTFHRSILRKDRLEILLGRLVAQIAYKNVHHLANPVTQKSSNEQQDTTEHIQ
jgi:hypothetical protein